MGCAGGPARYPLATHAGHAARDADWLCAGAGGWHRLRHAHRLLAMAAAGNLSTAGGLADDPDHHAGTAAGALVRLRAGLEVYRRAAGLFLPNCGGAGGWAALRRPRANPAVSRVPR